MYRISPGNIAYHLCAFFQQCLWTALTGNHVIYQKCEEEYGEEDDPWVFRSDKIHAEEGGREEEGERDVLRGYWCQLVGWYEGKVR
jgi:hypothetical protein